MTKKDCTMMTKENFSKHYSIIRDIGKALTSSLDMDDILQKIMSFIGELYSPVNWSLLLFDREKANLYFALAIGESTETLKDMKVRIGEGVAGWCAQHGRTIIIPDTSKDARFNNSFDQETKFHTDSIICIPLISKDETLGVLELINIDAKFFEKEYIEMLESIADFTAIAIENAWFVKQIRDISIHDDCTHLYNTRHMHNLIDAEISRSERAKRPFSLVFIDLDHFKSINDTYGHLVGSQLLREIAMILTENLRQTDWAVRYGGDEFVIVLPESGKADALQITERIRAMLNERIFFEAEGFNIKVTASFGIASFPEDAKTKAEIIKMADEAMYVVKKKGRNNIITADQL